MEAFHGMKKNTPSLLPVPSPRTSSDGLSIDPTMASQGTKRKRDHKSSESPLKTGMEAMENAKQIMKRLTKNLHSDIISKIDQVDTFSRKKATIGIFGRSGEGKSSLLNAILGKQDLLPSGCFGACTAVVTQVEANLTDSNYTAEIEFFSKEEWEEELKYLSRDIKDKSEDSNKDLKEVAVEKITALYGSDADKKTPEELKKDIKFAEIKTFLSVSKMVISKNDLSEFTNDVASFIQHSESSSGGWFWPLVKSVTIKIPGCHELLEHIVLLDLPGTGDYNKIREDLWKSKLRECSSVWIVSNINRAITDRDPLGILKHCIQELGPGGECKSINFICTKTDDINTRMYMRSARLPSDQISKDKDQEKVWCILHRNEYAKMRVQEKFKNSEIKKILNNDHQFQVFTVSSNAFFDHNLNLESSETEIPKLQDDLRNLNKNINRELTKDHVNEAKGVLSLIQSVQLDTDKKTIEVKINIRNDFEKKLMKSLNELEKRFDAIYNDLEQKLSKGVEESVKSCVTSTKELISAICYSTLEALCRKSGCHFPSKMTQILDLNKTLAKHLHEHIDEDFGQFFPVTGKTGKSVQEQIDKFSVIQSDSAYPSSDILHHIHNFIKIEETKLKSELKRHIVNIKKDIYSSIQTTIQNKMASCYKQAAAERGRGTVKRMQDLLIITVDEIKQDMFDEAKEEVLKKLNNLKIYIKDALESRLKRSMDLSLSQTSKITWTDVSSEIEQLERLSEQLLD